MPHGEAHLFSTGTNLVVALDDRLILKIFPPLLRHQFVSERISLTQLRGRFGVPIPEIVLEGERDGWPYLVITRLSGILGAQAWPTCRKTRKSACSARSARPSRKCSACRLENLCGSSRAGTSSFAGQIERCRARHERLGLAQKFLDGLDDFIRDAAPSFRWIAPPVILTGEYIPENFL